MKKVKITVLKTMLNEDLAMEYGICGLKACPMMKVGDVWKTSASAHSTGGLTANRRARHIS